MQIKEIRKGWRWRFSRWSPGCCEWRARVAALWLLNSNKLLVFQVSKIWIPLANKLQRESVWQRNLAATFASGYWQLYGFEKVLKSRKVRFKRRSALKTNNLDQHGAFAAVEMSASLGFATLNTQWFLGLEVDESELSANSGYDWSPPTPVKKRPVLGSVVEPIGKWVLSFCKVLTHTQSKVTVCKRQLIAESIRNWQIVRTSWTLAH